MNEFQDSAPQAGMKGTLTEGRERIAESDLSPAAFLAISLLFKPHTLVTASSLKIHCHLDEKNSQILLQEL